MISRDSLFQRRFRLLLCLALLALSLRSIAQPTPAINYVVSFSSLDQHLVYVLVILPRGAAQRELQLPVWNALYQIRDFSQYVNWIHAEDGSGHHLAVQAVDKSRWRIDGAQDGATVEYQIFADSPGPFGAQLNSHHAFFNLAQILMYPIDARNAPIRLKFANVPERWRAATPLESHSERSPEIENYARQIDVYPEPSVSETGFTAPNYDRLVDSPVEIGDFREIAFDEAGGHFLVAVDADPADYDMEKIVAALHKIVSAAVSWMNDRPFDTYTFLYHFPRGPGGGGMEHAFSTAIEVNAEVEKQNFSALTGVTAHEFFHLWNVKRIRPRTLEPVDYTKENYTRALWFSEGVTSTAEGIIQLRAGLLDEQQYLARLGNGITELESRPAHLTQSAEESSLDAWLEGDPYYRRPERSISYYNKGELLGIMLDLAVRDASHGQASLREVLQWMNANFAKKRIFFDDSNGVRQAAEAVSHADLGWFFSKYVSGTEEIPWDDFLRSVGLHVAKVPNTLPDAGFTASRNFDGPMSVIAVAPGGEAEHAGLQVGDILIELQGKPGGRESRNELNRLVPGDTITVRVRDRRGTERELKWKVGGREEISYEVKDLDQVTPEQRARRAAWLKGEAQTSANASVPSSREPALFFAGREPALSAPGAQATGSRTGISCQPEPSPRTGVP